MEDKYNLGRFLEAQETQYSKTYLEIKNEKKEMFPNKVPKKTKRNKIVFSI